jgi:hypothetical protein
MASDTTVCSNALIRLGDKPITDLSDPDERARICQALFADTRDAVFRAHPWRCLVHRAALALEATAPLFDWAHAFTLPTSPWCLRVLRTNLDDNAWTVEGRSVLTNAGSVSIAYIARITDYAVLDALLIEALTARMAAEMAVSITGNQNLGVTSFNVYLSKVSEAWSTNAMEQSPDILISDALTRVR